MPSSSPSPVRALLGYTALRFLFFGAAVGLGILVGLRGLPLLLVALLVSSIGSVLVLRGQRDRMAGAFVARSEARRAERQRLRKRLDDTPTG
ncbi:MAG TPA: DUF4229 domain-containing protein [Mycobacteriales bacterium]|nr:DUF4229 domain-containing protein [Mycobacteriales bacterium]